MVLAAISALCTSCADSQTRPDLLDELGCGACHSGLPVATVATERAPDLQRAGFRFRPAYVFDYLQGPGPVRRNIGNTRMPDYGFSAREALALTLFLGERRQSDGGAARALPVGLAANATARGENASTESLITESYRCTACHTLDGVGLETASELRGTGSRLNPSWIRTFLVDPDEALLGPETMPSFFFQFDNDSRTYQSFVPDALDDLHAIADYLARDSDPNQTVAERSYAEAQRQYPETTAVEGEHLFRAQNCGACHGRIDGDQPRRTAPDLSIEAARVRRGWLESYLIHPRPVRPSGSPVGSGARMPGFRLSDTEARDLTDQLAALAGEADLPDRPSGTPLSQFSMTKAHRLIEERLPCLGCHRLGGKGGAIGPDLSSLAERLQPAFVERLVTEPHALLPDTVMPRPGLADSQAGLVVRFLLQQTLAPDPPRYLDLPVPVAVDETEMSDGERLYHRYCAACHGGEGGGDGFNAERLPTKPRNFTDADYMSSRPDDTLFDGIAAGGRILGKSNHMPAWGGTLSDNDIVSLVLYLRVLCGCEGPEWSRDGGAFEQGSEESES